VDVKLGVSNLGRSCNEAAGEQVAAKNVWAWEEESSRRWRIMI